MRLLAIFVLTLSALANTCTSQAAGNWSSSATWTSCGSTYPQDGDNVVILHAVVLDHDAGTVAGGIHHLQINATGADLTTDGAAPHTIYFASTGSDPVGSGSAGNPGTDATMFGILLDAGTLDFSAATATNFITIRAADGTHPVYIRHEYDGAAGNVAVVLRLAYTKIPNLGVNVSGFYGIFNQDYPLPPSSIDIDHCLFSNPYQVLYVFSFSGPPYSPSISYTHNTSYGVQADNTLYMFSTSNWTVTDNTDYNASKDWGTFLGGIYAPGAVILDRNVLLPGSTYSKELADNNTAIGAAATVSYNLALLNSTTNINTLMLVPADAYSLTVDHNIFEGGYHMIPAGGATIASVNDIHDNIFRAVAGVTTGQADIITYGGNSEVRNNLFTSTAGQAGGTAFCYNGKPLLYSGNTSYYPDLASGSNGSVIGEGGYPCASGILVKNNIAFQGQNGFYDGAGPTNVYAIDFDSVGVHHNDTFGNTSAYDLNAGTPTNYSDGVHSHPDAVYGDVTINPGLADPTRTALTYDAWIGGAGTLASLASGFANRCGLTGTTWNPAYDVAKMWNWIRAGYTPTNALLATASDTGSYLGAVQPAIPSAVIGQIQ